MFKKAGKEKGHISKYQFWQHNNNPVVYGFVSTLIDCKYSSANNFADDHTVLRIDNIEFLG